MFEKFSKFFDLKNFRDSTLTNFKFRYTVRAVNTDHELRKQEFVVGFVSGGAIHYLASGKGSHNCKNYHFSIRNNFGENFFIVGPA